MPVLTSISCALTPGSLSSEMVHEIEVSLVFRSTDAVRSAMLI